VQFALAVAVQFDTKNSSGGHWALQSEQAVSWMDEQFNSTYCRSLHVEQFRQVASRYSEHAVARNSPV
jgi:hypothetical protein